MHLQNFQKQIRVVLQNRAIIVNLEPKHAILQTLSSRNNLVKTPTIKTLLSVYSYIAKVWEAQNVLGINDTKFTR